MIRRALKAGFDIAVSRSSGEVLLRGERFQISDDVGPLIGVWDALKR